MARDGLRRWSSTRTFGFGALGLLGPWATWRSHRTEAWTDADAPALAVVQLDARGRVREWDVGATHQLGYSPEQAHGRTLEELVFPREALERGEARRIWDEVERRGWSQGESLRRRGDGTRLWLDWYLVRGAGPDGRLRGFTYCCKDVTVRRQDEEERRGLLARERATRAALQRTLADQTLLAQAALCLSASLAVPAPLVEALRCVLPRLGQWCAADLAAGPEGGAGAGPDAGGEPPAGALHRVAFVAARPGGEREAALLLGRQPAAAGPWAERLAHRSDEPLVLEASPPVLDALTGGRPEAREALERLRPRSLLVASVCIRERWLGRLVFLSPVPHAYGEAEARLAADLAWRCAMALDNARLYREAQGAIVARDEFLSVAAHELKTPLTSLQLRLAGLERALKDLPASPAAERVGRTLGLFHRQTRKLGRLVEQLLDISHIRLGRLELSPSRADVAALAREVAAGFEEEAAQRASPLLLEAPERLEAWCDAGRLEQVLTNLLSNAFKYGEGRPVRLSLAASGGLVHLRVRDEGIGIPPEKQQRIFGRFERAVSADHYGGLGLGLSVVRDIVEAHGGSIAVESAEGQGATFTVRLPQWPGAAPERGTCGVTVH
jgi:PAS domain S-box-containing protein